MHCGWQCAYFMYGVFRALCVRAAFLADGDVRNMIGWEKRAEKENEKGTGIFEALARRNVK